MSANQLRRVLLLGAGLTLTAGPAWTQSDCLSRIDAFRASTDIDAMQPAQQKRVDSLLQGAREFAEQDQQRACLDTLAQLQDLVGEAEQVTFGGAEPDPHREQTAAGQQQGAGPGAPPVPQPKAANGDQQVTPQDAPQAPGGAADMATASQAQPQGQAQEQAQPGAGQAQPQQEDQAEQQLQRAQEQLRQRQQQAQGGTEPAIGGGPDVPRDQIQARYGPLAWLSFDQVVGARVQDQSGATVAEIIALVRDREDGQFFAVLDTGAAEEMVLPMDRLEVDDQQQIALVPGAEDQMQRFEEGAYEMVRTAR